MGENKEKAQQQGIKVTGREGEKQVHQMTKGRPLYRLMPLEDPPSPACIRGKLWPMSRGCRVLNRAFFYCIFPLNIRVQAQYGEFVLILRITEYYGVELHTEETERPCLAWPGLVLLHPDLHGSRQAMACCASSSQLAFSLQCCILLRAQKLTSLICPHPKRTAKGGSSQDVERSEQRVEQRVPNGVHRLTARGLSVHHQTGQCSQPE